MKTLTLIDLVVLKAVHDGNHPTQTELLEPNTKQGLVNDLIVCLDLPHIYNVRLLTANWGLLASITQLREAGLMPVSAPYKLTKEGEHFFDLLGDDVRSWPISVPYHPNDVHLNRATYIPEELR